MQKKIIALAVAGLVSGAAFAQTNVTIYGVADAAYVNSSGERAGTAKGSANFSGIQSGGLSSSRIGFKGQEDLGNSLKAVFTLEYQLAIDGNVGIGTGSLAAHQQWVGLKSTKLGQVALGRQYAPGHGAEVRADAFAASGVASPLLYLASAGGNSIVAGSPARINNSVTYASPKMAGFTVNAIYGFGENNGNADTASNGVSSGNNGLFGAGLNYANGGLNVDAVFQTRRDTTTVVATNTATQDNINEWMLGASYDFKVVKVYASYQRQNDDNGTSATEASNKIWSIGATVPVFSKGKVHVSYADLSWDRTGAGDSDAWAIGYTHSLSKRTTLYTTFTQVDNDNDAVVAAGFSNTRALGEKNSTFAAGIRHTF